MKPTVFIVEDDPSTVELLRELFSQENYQIRCFSSPLQALEMLSGEGLPDLILTDLMMPEMDGITFLIKIRHLSSRVPVIVMTAYGSIETAVEALKKGAHDYITKPLNFEELRMTVNQALELSSLRLQMDKMLKNIHQRYSPAALMGEHELIRQARLQLLQVAEASTTCVLLRGESGTGKNLAAGIIHYNSPLADGPFVELSCAAFPASLLEAELFGYRKGAFTGAVSDKPGLIERADGGTLFLDEIAELSLETQAKLLNFLESHHLRRIGDINVREVNIRLITATNRNLEKAVAIGIFREDLFYRINVVHCQLPPLRELGRDLLILARHFVAEFNLQFNKQVAGLSSDAEQLLLSHRWPGNVRELRNVIERAMLFAAGQRLEKENLILSGPQEEKPADGFRIPEDGLDWEQHEREIIVQALERCGYNQSKAARLLSMTRDTFIYRLKKYGLG